ncbi:gem-associated protein 5 isoform X2 [Vespula maculifrons]|uniref:Gem-associated protein 5 isoform X2 n=1 Tax=Vespula maculifrons TaxID=7453 RepID=A0ABD2B4L1_VESMC
MSTYHIFNQLRIIHPQFRPKSRTSVLEPSQNFLSSEVSEVPRGILSSVGFCTLAVIGRQVAYLFLRDCVFNFKECSIAIVKARKKEAICQRGPHDPWLKRATIRLLSYFRRFKKTFREWLFVIFSFTTLSMLYNALIICDFSHSISVMNIGIYCLIRLSDSTTRDLTFFSFRNYIAVAYNATIITILDLSDLKK